MGKNKIPQERQEKNNGKLEHFVVKLFMDGTVKYKLPQRP
jgi:hypothetical protein